MPPTIKEVAERAGVSVSTVSRVLNDYPYVREETRRRVPDTGRARDVLGFEAQIPLEEGLRRTIDWFRQQRAAG